MIVHIGGNKVVPAKSIIAIIGLDVKEESNINREFLQIAKDEDFVEKVSNEKTKSLVITEYRQETVIYMSPISSSTLLKRSSVGLIGSI
ncbi:MAG: DUF370 domain-containing protein [Clostridiales bacterium]|nr:DUF370 domain-containing protein [Clostridiales bacterium]